MITRAAAVLVMTLFCTGQAQAQDSKFYYGLSLTSTDFELAGVESNGIGFKLGREFGKYIMIEAHIGNSSESSDNLLGDPDLTYSGAFLRLNLPFERMNIYVVGGAASINANLTGFDDSEVDRAVGFGFDLLASENSALTIEVIDYGTEDELELIETVQLGFTHRFDFPGLR
ncbi:MAG TPA: outer membrane beta-barrel protein [Gammaproteobacteria bacterium]